MSALSLTLHQAIEEIMKRTASIGDEAGRLAKALRHENKIQGNWGEAILSELASSFACCSWMSWISRCSIFLSDSSDDMVLTDLALAISQPAIAPIVTQKRNGRIAYSPNARTEPK